MKKFARDLTKKMLRSVRVILCSHEWNVYTGDTYIECIKCGTTRWQ